MEIIGSLLVARPAGKRNTLRYGMFVYITGVTDHHQNAQPQTMARIAERDVWRWSTALSANWRGSYCFIPTERDVAFAKRCRAKRPDRGNHCVKGWRQLLPQAIADPLNSQAGVYGHAVSALEMPDAPFSRDGIVPPRRTAAFDDAVA